VIVPTTLPLPDTLRKLTDARDEMALVIDEYGSFAGVLTVEDLAEELVGEIADEHDSDTAEMVPADDGWLIRGDVALDEVGRTVGYDLPEGDYETLAGLVIAEFGGLPGVGDAVRIDLGADPADLAAGHPPVARRLHAEVRAIEKRVPALIFVSLTAEGSDHE
jgi:CBS domain containing-hemolysin-like protein